MNIKQFIPWWGKIGAKLLLSRFPLKYSFWKKLALFEHGNMDNCIYAYEIFKQHFERVGGINKKGFVSLELGPGDSLLSAMVSRAFGGASSYLVDVGAFASIDLQPYLDMASFLEAKGLPTINIDSSNSLEEVMIACNAQYSTLGLSSLRNIPEQSVDFIWSNAVLEHIKRADFLDILRELRRIIRSNGVCSHQIDLRDHMGGALNHLRFSEQVWESDFMANSGFYTNRIPYSEMLNLFRKAEFMVEVVDRKSWHSLPTPRSKLSKKFQLLSDEELCISGFTVLLKPI
jgi:predicted SAM-dependent methyltransferase